MSNILNLIMSIIIRTINYILSCNVEDTEPFVIKDVTNCAAFYFSGDPFFEIKPLIIYRLDFSKEKDFIQLLRKVSALPIVSNCSDHSLYKDNFGYLALAVIYILDQLTRNDRYNTLRISQQRQIILRDGMENAVVIENISCAENKTLLFDLGTVYSLIQSL